MIFTRFVLKRPITTLLCVLCLIVFGWTSVTSAPLELTPEMDMPMMVVVVTYSGASPDDVNELIAKPLEDSLSTLNGLKSLTSGANEGAALVLLEYEYGINLDKAYNDLKKIVDLLANYMPDDAGDPFIMEINMNTDTTMSLSVNHQSTSNLYDYVNNNIVPELEKISSIAEVSVAGGSQEYIKIELIPEKLDQYNMTMASVASDITIADLAYPAGTTRVGGLELSMSTSLQTPTLETLGEIPLTTARKDIVYLADVANIYMNESSTGSIARYNGDETLSISISKQQSATAMDVSKAVMRTINNLMSQDADLEIITINDNSESIMESLASVVETLILAIAISMVIIILFMGDIKASLIIGSSIPISILSALILMNLMNFSLNVITMSALVLGVGMMVDNSIVVLESCFRSTKGSKGFKEYLEAASEGTRLVINSVIGGTATTCVVFLPLAFLSGMTGQLFKPLGFTIVFCLGASLLSAITIVPLCYLLYKPTERDSAPAAKPLENLQDSYRKILGFILPKRKTVMFVSISLLAFSLFLATKLGVELIASDDQGAININIKVRPGLHIDTIDEIMMKVEAVIMEHEDLAAYIASYGGGGISLDASESATIAAYLKSNRKLSTNEVVKEWKQTLADIENCSISVEANASMSLMTSTSESYSIILQSTDYDTLKIVSANVVQALVDRPEVHQVHSSLENASPVVKIEIDAIRAKAAGLTAPGIGSTVNQMVNGIEATTLDMNGSNVSVMVEYADGEYQSIDQIQNIVLTTGIGSYVALTEVADIIFQDSPTNIMRRNREYQVTIEAEYTELANEKTAKLLQKEVINANLSENVSIGISTMDQMMEDEFSALYGAIAVAAFLIFVVMAAQFESPKYSLMVMTTVPFSLIGSIGLLYLADSKISMVSLLGFLMLIGTVVNNGILYVDTVNQYREVMSLETALIEAGATRLRPILMTTLTTVLSMIPMAMAWGNSGSMTQGLALVNIGGLLASTLLSLLLLPVYYDMMSSRKAAVWVEGHHEEA